jgi:HPt (histidine-containing phosphotransfer) domain-containing protein
MNPSGPHNEVLEAALIEELRQNLTPAMRGELVEAFRAQVQRSVGELSDAIRLGDDAQLRRVAHGLKGSSASLGASRLRYLCERLGEARAAGVPGRGDGQLAELRQVSEESLRAVTEALA